MPRDGSGVYTRPPGTDGIPDTTIESGKYNSFVGDVETDLNTPRPIVAGGTGATSAAAARANLKAEVAAVAVTNYDSHAFETGSFYSLPGATAAPSVNGISGTAVVFDSDPNFITLQARDIATGIPWMRIKTAGTWGAWSIEDPTGKVNRSGDAMTGALIVPAVTAGTLTVGGFPVEVSGVQVTNFNTHVFQNGSWWAASSATGAPVAGRAFSGIVYGQNSNNLVVQAFDVNFTLGVLAYAPSTFYNPGDVRQDTTDNTVWQCNIAHLTGPGTFASIRASLPGYWSPYPATGIKLYYRVKTGGVWGAWLPE
jgi:hypothetical protein